MENQLCMLACSALGELGLWGQLITLIIACVGTGYGVIQRRGKQATESKVNELAAERSALEAEIKVLSLRPPPIAVIANTAELERLISPAAAQPAPPSDAPAPLSDAPSYDAPPDETLG